MNMEDRIDDILDQFIKAADEMIDILDAETQALSENDFGYPLKIIDRKTKAIESFGAASDALRSEYEDIKPQLDEDEKKMLQDLRRDVVESFEANQRIVQIKKEAAERVLSILKDSAKEASGQVDRYTNRAILHHDEQKTAGKPMKLHKNF